MSIVRSSEEGAPLFCKLETKAYNTQSEKQSDRWTHERIERLELIVSELCAIIENNVEIKENEDDS